MANEYLGTDQHLMDLSNATIKNGAKIKQLREQVFVLAAIAVIQAGLLLAVVALG